MTSAHRFVFLGLIMPLVYYGVIPFTILGMALLAAVFGQIVIPFGSLGSVWLILAILFFASGLYVRRMLRQTKGGLPVSDEDHERELFRTAMYDSSPARSG
jgi:uncharacterized membrane protein